MRLTHLLTWIWTGVLIVNANDQRVEFNRDIRPILSENCFFCHGFDAKNRKADLRLDTFAGATDDLGGYQAVVPGDPSASELIQRINAPHADDLMPPPESEKRLTAEQRALLSRWIQEGAQYQEHWAWRPLTRPNLPESLPKKTVIDSFLAARWKEQGAIPVGAASPREQLRRLSFDLRGLPPTAAEVAHFEANPSDAQFRTWRNRWMTDLAYAEHQAVQWLDLVRWADTSGFVSDEPIASGAYRAWIIESFAQNQPFDQFSIEQLAGDLLPQPSDDQFIASGYNRIVNTNCEAGAIEEEQLYKLKNEHVRALGTVWLGMTTGCAECHDHKFDPFSAKDYYSLAAFFDDLVEAGVYTPGDRREPLHYVHDRPEQSRLDKRLSTEVHSLRAHLNDTPKVDSAAWETRMLKRLNDSETRTDFIWAPGRLPAPRILEGNYLELSAGDEVHRETYAQHNEFHRHHAAEFMTGFLSEKGQTTDEQKDAWFADVWIDPNNRPSMIGLQISHGDYGRLGWRTANYETYYWGDDRSGELHRPQRWSNPERVKRLGEIPPASGWVRLRVPFNERIKPVSGQSFVAVGMAWLHTGGRMRWGNSGLELRTDKTVALQLGETGNRRWWETPWNRQVYQSRSTYVSKSLKTVAGERDSLQQAIVRQAFLEGTQTQLMQELRAQESKLYQLRARALPVLVSRQAPQRKITRLLNRGDYQDKTGPILNPAVPEFLGTLSNGDKPLTRLDLANWLFEENSALVARVYVNRLWHQFYGRGLSESLEDSGTQGSWPSHPDLLDWLAVEFRESGWDRQHMIRLLTNSDAYRLSSTPTPDLAARDPENRWHARQGRFRLTAEAIRDTALRAAGLLKTNLEVPKTSFFPYQPDPYWTRSDKVMFGSRHMHWDTSPDRQQYQRSLYTFWKRQNIHPTMLAFDAPTRQECTAKRNITNTPGQALALLNDPIFVEAARALATQLVDSQQNDVERIRIAYRRALQRTPSEQEARILLELLTTQRAHFETNTEAATQLVAIGQDAQARDDVAEVAAWTIVTRTLLNLHEFLNRS